MICFEPRSTLFTVKNRRFCNMDTLFRSQRPLQEEQTAIRASQKTNPFAADRGDRAYDDFLKFGRQK